MNRICDAGGRYLHWIGYRSLETPTKGSDFKYLGHYQTLEVDGWRKGQPNAKHGTMQNEEQRLVSYFGLEPSASW